MAEPSTRKLKDHCRRTQLCFTFVSKPVRRLKGVNNTEHSAGLNWALSWLIDDQYLRHCVDPNHTQRLLMPLIIFVMSFDIYSNFYYNS